MTEHKDERSTRSCWRIANLWAHVDVADSLQESMQERSSLLLAGLVNVWGKPSPDALAFSVARHGPSSAENTKSRPVQFTSRLSSWNVTDGNDQAS